MGKQYVVTLTGQERSPLQQLISSGSQRAQYLRNARILLKADQSVGGPSWQDQPISDALEVSVATVERVRQRFFEQGLEAALRRRTRRPPPAAKVDGEQEAHLVALACSTPPPGRTRWTLQLLADKLVELEEIETLSDETVRRVLRRNQLKPWLKQMWVIPPQHNAAFVYHMEDVLDVYTRPVDAHCPLVCFDERPVQLLSDLHPALTPTLDHPLRYDYEYKREGVVNLFLFFAPHVAWRSVKVTARRTKIDCATCLRELVDVHFPDATRIIVVRDQLNTHGPEALYQAFDPREAKRILRRLEFHSTPKHGSWLNMAELELSVLARQCLARRLPDRASLSDEIAAWQTARNAAQATVDWHFTTAEARIKLKRLYPILKERGA